MNSTTETVITPPMDQETLGDPFWFYDISIIYNRYIEFFPSFDQTNNEKLNAILRLFIIIAVVLMLYKSSVKYLIIPFVVAAITIFIHAYKSNKDKLEVLPEEEYTLPTKENPYMNPLVGDSIDKKPAIDYLSNKDPRSLKIREDIKKYFDQSITYKEVDDAYCTYTQEREFYTVPNATFQDGRNEFEKWLYKENSESNCKQSTNNCDILDDYKRTEPITFAPFEVN